MVPVLTFEASRRDGVGDQGGAQPGSLGSGVRLHFASRQRRLADDARRDNLTLRPGDVDVLEHKDWLSGTP